jgi:quercetin dioxygenase-like cupin family protein
VPVLRSADAAVHEAHGSRFTSYVAPTRGSRDLAAWRLDVPAGLRGVAHRPTREEVLLVLTGRLHLTLDGAEHHLEPGDVALVPAHSEIRVGAGPHGASAWVTTTPGLEATLPDGSRFAPPWAH